jgi:DNA-binding GntR family transcriptional regulator
MDTSTLANRVYRILRDKILQGDFAPGERINLTSLAQQLEVSNTPVREAVARLERLGLLEVIPYRGCYIQALNPSQMADVFDVRIALEELAARFAARRVTSELLQQMKATIQAYEEAYSDGDTLGVIEADRAFHDTLVQASGSSVLLDMLPTLSDLTRLLIAMNAPRPGKPVHKTALEGHQRILDALMEGDEDRAAQALREELRRARGHLLEHVIPKEMAPRQQVTEHP